MSDKTITFVAVGLIGGGIGGLLGLPIVPCVAIACSLLAYFGG
jgi:hypothetical protein